jgi:hypothetical protein
MIIKNLRGPGTPGTAGSIDTAKLVQSAYETDFRREVHRTHQEMSRRGIRLTDAEAGSLVQQRLANGEPGVLPNYERALATAQRMENDQ